MDVILLVSVSFIGYIIAYHTYGKFLGKKIFKLSSKNKVPSKQLEDGKDYVPTKRGVIFGHHYTSIAGTGPIVGPAVGIIWGWIPALIWIFVGSIAMGAVHDLGALVISLRNQGKSVSDCAGKIVHPRIKHIFFFIVFFELLIVIAIFGLVIAVIFAKYPQSIFPVWMQIPIAIGLGIAVYKKNWHLIACTAIAVVLMYLTIIAGNWISFDITNIISPKILPSTGSWTILLLVYAFIASTLSVTTLLQPRDYINAWQLFVTMGLMVAGVFSAGLFNEMHIVAPAVNFHPQGAPPIAPFLFITIACGAISGFHSLVSSGTTSKQVSDEEHALPVSYGSMLMEAVLATLVIAAVAGGIGMAYKMSDGTILTGNAAWQHHYSSWQAAKGLGSKLDAFVIGSANMITTIGIPKNIAIIIIGVFVASFAGTTLDTATRLQRYIVAEFFQNLKIKFMTKKYPATLFAVVTAAILAFVSGADGKGALTLWPMFGAVNQLLAALGLLVISAYLKKQGGKKFLLTFIPCLFMLGMTFWAVILNEIDFIQAKNYLLLVVNGITGLLAVWMTIETFVVFNKLKTKV